jgi:enoyl-[acyl-carrier protein] reductase II
MRGVGRVPGPPRGGGSLFHTVLCDLLGICHPILQGAMQGAGGPRLVAAVSEAGGLGVLPTFGGTAEQLRRDIEATRELTDARFGVNITPMGAAFTESRAKICVEMEVPIVTTGRGDPGTPIVRLLREAGILVLPVVPSVAHALRVEEEGADAIVASGCEAGGHVGSVATFPLLPQVVDAVGVPVVAAGGIGDGRGFLAALALGACGIQLGTRLIASQESEAPQGYKERILEARETDTLVTAALTGKTVRALVTPTLRTYESARLRGAPAEELEPLVRELRAAVRSGWREDTPGAAGQICGLVREIRPVAEILEDILSGAAELAGRLGVLAGRESRSGPTGSKLGSG